MNIVSFIHHKRSGGEHPPHDLADFVGGIAGRGIPDYQIAAWLMAVCWRGMTLAETAELTRLLASSGQMLDLSTIALPKVDKHSTGGVGDKVTLVLGPLVASAGAAMAKLSGRGLGHTGGTVDKLESIPGFQADLAVDAFIRQVQEIGIAIAGQTKDLAPVDGYLYALRDVTATIESIPLIAASVLAKKIAAGTDVILIDVKYGSGAFMKDLYGARELARIMVEVGYRLHKSVSVIISGMDQPLGHAVGNALEIVEAIQTLRGQGPPDVTDLCLQLGAILLHMAGIVPAAEVGKGILKGSLADGRALAKFGQLVKAQGGNGEVLDNPDALVNAQYQLPLKSTESGYVTAIDALQVGEAVRLLGGGREKIGDPIDYSVGVVLHRKACELVTEGDLLATIHANDLRKAEAAQARIAAAYRFGPELIEPGPLVRDVLLSRQ